MLFYAETKPLISNAFYLVSTHIIGNKNQVKFLNDYINQCRQSGVIDHNHVRDRVEDKRVIIFLFCSNKMVEALILIKNKKRNGYSFQCLLFILSYFMIFMCWIWRWLHHAKNTTPVTMSAKQVETKHALKIIFHGFLG